MSGRIAWLLGLCPSCGTRLGRRRTGASGFRYRQCDNRKCDTIAVGIGWPP